MAQPISVTCLACDGLGVVQVEQGAYGLLPQHEMERLIEGCTSCDWTGDPPDEDRCPECGKEGTMLRCRDIDLDEDVRSAAYRYDAFNEGYEFSVQYAERRLREAVKRAAALPQFAHVADFDVFVQAVRAIWKEAAALPVAER